MRTERRLLHAVFQQAPVPLFLLEQDGTIRRANNKAAALLGVAVRVRDRQAARRVRRPAVRAAVQTQLAAVARTGKPRTASCRLLTANGPVDATLTAAAADLPGDPPVLIVTAPPGGRRPRPAETGRGQRGQRRRKGRAAKARRTPPSPP